MKLKTILTIIATAWIATPLASAATYSGNTNIGFGGPVGTGSLSITDDGVNLTFTFTRGTSGDFNDFLVIYFDTTAGGAASLPTSGEIGDPFSGRRAIVNEYGSGITFPTAFTSDFGFALKSNGSTSNHLFTTPSGADANTVGFVTAPTVSNFGSVSAASYSWSIPVTSLGMAENSGATFNFVTTYLNPNGGGGGDASFRSNEAFGISIDGGNPGFDSLTFSSSSSYTIVPEPASTVLGLIGAMLILRRRK